jgi:sulfur-oxidizing protein SoxZ|tara:strand:+ start:38 stop:352 length:315 start_codon:yes stop_codon:yes gene_type:complete
MASTIRLKTKIRNNITTVRAIIRHPMETGFRISDETGKLVPEHYIKKVLVKHNNNIIFSCDWSRAVSKNPYLSFMFENSKVGDKIEIAWFDTEGKNETLETLIQ